MTIRDDTRAEAERIQQSNDIADTVIEVAQQKAPSEFVTLDFRYGIADALWDAGYRKVAQADRRELAEKFAHQRQNTEAAIDELAAWIDAREVNRG